MTKKKSPMEARREAEVAIAEIDLERAKTVKAIFERPEIVKAREELEAIFDTSPGAAQTGAATNINALIKSGITALSSMAGHADGHIATMEAVIAGPPPAPPSPAITNVSPALATPAT